MIQRRLFEQITLQVPPIMAFHLGSLGFLTPFKFEDFETQVKSFSCSEKDEGSILISVSYIV